MPWQAVEKDYRFEGPDGPASLLDLFDGRRQLLLYRAFYEPGVAGWPEHGCVGCSFMADHVPNLAHLNARDTTLVYASRAPQADIERLKARMGWEHIPWYTMTDDFDVDFGVDEWHGTNAFIRDGDRIFRTYFTSAPRRRVDGQHLELPRPHGARAPGGVGGLAGGLPPDAAVRVVEVARRLRRRDVAGAPRADRARPGGPRRRPPESGRRRRRSSAAPCSRTPRWGRHCPSRSPVRARRRVRPARGGDQHVEGQRHRAPVERLLAVQHEQLALGDGASGRISTPSAAVERERRQDRDAEAARTRRAAPRG